MSNKIICPKCGNSKKFYVECSTPAKVEYNPYTQEYGKIFDIDGVQLDNVFETIYCRKCNFEIETDEE